MIARRLDYREEARWPPLAWLAVLEPGAETVLVRHGSRVETRADWFGEVVWDGRFEDGGLDETDIVAGSGGRLRGDRTIFVSSGSTVDRLQWIHWENRFWVSNSLVCLLAAVGGALDPAYPHYFRDFHSIIHGLDLYVSRMETTLGDVRLVYFHNLEWDGRSLASREKPGEGREFGSFAEYRRFLSDSLERLRANMEDGARWRPYSMLGSLSTGYDSATVTVLAREVGLEEVVCFRREEGRDDGASIASHFGVRPIVVPIDEWCRARKPEVRFIAANSFGEEVHYAPLEPLLAGRVLMTGFNGDKLWDKEAPYMGTTVVRGDLSGSGLTEFRLHAGFLHCPVPFWACRDVAAVNGVSRLAEMEPWDLGGTYNRPICRRIVETASVPRDAFGRQKSYASRWMVLSPDFLTAESREDYFEWIRENRSSWHRRMRLAPACNERWDRFRLDVCRGLSGAMLNTPGLFRLGLHRRGVLGQLAALRIPGRQAPLALGFRRYVFPWAVERSKAFYPADGA